MVNATASPDPVARGASCLITVDVSDPDGSVASVVGDLTPFGGAPGEAWYDDGTNGDTFPSDGTWTLRAPVATTATPGPASIVLTATDDLGATSSGPVPVTIKTNLVPVLSNPLATPALAKPGALMLFSVGASDDGSIASVAVDLVTLGGSSTQAMVDDGTQGDATASDGTYSFEYTIPSGQNLGNRTLPVTAVDDQGDSASTAITCTVIPNQPPTVSNEAVTPSSPVQGGQILLTAMASDADGTVTGVSVNLLPLNGPASQPMLDDGTGGDATAGDGTWSVQYTIPLTVGVGSKTLPVTAVDDDSAMGTGAIQFILNPNPGPTLSNAGTNPAQATGEDTVTFLIDATDSDGVASVTVDLTALGGGASTPMNVTTAPTYACQLTLSAHVAPGMYSLPVTAQDTQSATSTGAIPLCVLRIRVEMSNFLYGISASSATNMIVTGEQGVTFHFDGMVWRMVNIKNTETPKGQRGDLRREGHLQPFRRVGLGVPEDRRNPHEPVSGSVGTEPDPGLRRGHIGEHLQMERFRLVVGDDGDDPVLPGVVGKFGFVHRGVGE
jgi:hypothetical protein